MSGGVQRSERGQAGLVQLLVGLVALPLSVLPFVAYGTLTPEGRLVRDRVMARLARPKLPTLSPGRRAAAAARAPRYQDAVMVLAYHGIGSSSDAEGGYVISPQRFGEHLAVLRAAGMRTVTATDVARAFTGGPPLPANAVMISFDDGRTDAMLFADPLLKQAGMSATMFVITGAASHPGVYYAPWGRIEAYARSGRWDIESHTAELHRQETGPSGEDLPVLTSLRRGESLADYRARVRADLTKASATIAKHVGHRPVAFAYPFGAYGADRTNDPGIRDVLREEVARQYTLAFHQDDQGSIPLAAAGQDHLGLRRLEVGRWSGLELLSRISQAASRSGVVTPPGAPTEVVPLGGPSDADALALAGPNAPAGSPGGAARTASGAPVLGVGIDVPGAVVTNPASPAASSALAPTRGPTVVAPPTSTPPPTVAPPVTSPPTTSPPVTSPPTTSAPGCGHGSSGRNPKKCTGGGG